MKTFFIASVVLVAILIGCTPAPEEVGEIPVREETIVEVPEVVLEEIITENSVSLLPTLNDFEIGWEISSDAEKDLAVLPTVEVMKAEDLGFIEGHDKAFERGSIKNLDNYVQVTFSVSLFERAKSALAINNTRNALEQGSRSFLERNEDLYYNYTLGRWVTLELDEQITESLSRLRDPQIGDESVFYSVKENRIADEQKKYCVEFIEKNVLVKVCCLSADTELCIDMTQQQAQLVSGKI